ncbi:hypothetical protein H2200_001404 [Cladophialophora chaetospira]|uniref:Oxidoreductase NAD-binding domain-containing protein 1 n=1 Tax=Cladophialophora chaetospira TaxID=386627 RepID=A0AA38XKT1_9EURO|nr:hypothetical protein H2200_001404 [Cladophialophora chaetospira]
MATVKDSIPHVIRTAEDHRQQGIWTARLSKIDQVNSKIRLLRLSLPKDGVGQYIDLYIPNIDVVGGFTITSPPQASSQSQEDPHIELAIQDSPSNPPAAYLWRPKSEILDSTVSFKVGGNFVYPPPTFDRGKCERIKRAVFIAGGVGINPIMSMISAMHEAGANRLGGMVQEVRVLYSARPEKQTDTGEVEEILFANRLRDIADQWKGHKHVSLHFKQFITGGTSEMSDSGAQPIRGRRISKHDLEDALGPAAQRENTVVYVCGLPTMTDDFVEWLKKAPGMDGKRVLCEKWW